MKSDRRAIFHLLAMGRVTPAQAERLLLAIDERHESFWFLALALLVASAANLNNIHFLVSVDSPLRATLSAGLAVLHQFTATLTHTFGGVL